MRPLYKLILIFAVLLTLSACHKDEDELFTTVLIEINETDGIHIEQLQATAQLLNLNSRNVKVSSDFEGRACRMEVLRGSYSISIEGILRYTTQDGTQRMSHFRALSDFIPLAEKDYNSVQLDIIFMD